MRWRKPRQGEHERRSAHRAGDCRGFDEAGSVFVLRLHVEGGGCSDDAEDAEHDEVEPAELFVEAMAEEDVGCDAQGGREEGDFRGREVAFAVETHCGSMLRGWSVDWLLGVK